LLGQAELILIAGGRAVADYGEAFVEIDVAKLKNAIAVADSDRDGEVGYFGEVDASDASRQTISART
jgi:transposase